MRSVTAGQYGETERLLLTAGDARRSDTERSEAMTQANSLLLFYGLAKNADCESMFGPDDSPDALRDIDAAVSSALVDALMIHCRVLESGAGQAAKN